MLVLPAGNEQMDYAVAFRREPVGNVGTMAISRIALRAHDAHAGFAARPGKCDRVAEEFFEGRRTGHRALMTPNVVVNGGLAR